MIINPDRSRHPTITDDSILGFYDDYRFLSNFHYCPVKVDSIVYPTSEHAYMALKTLDHKTREFIAKLRTPSEAKQFGKTLTLRSYWDDYRPVAMYRVLRAKFYLNSDLAKKLFDTGDKYLEETNNWNDVYWGVCKGVGQNMLGKMLMCVRDEMK